MRRSCERLHLGKRIESGLETNFMKKVFSILSMVALSTCFMACGDDDEGAPASGIDAGGGDGDTAPGDGDGGITPGDGDGDITPGDGDAGGSIPGDGDSDASTSVGDAGDTDASTGAGDGGDGGGLGADAGDAGVCPATEPLADAGACQPGSICDYGATHCVCASGNWLCL